MEALTVALEGEVGSGAFGINTTSSDTDLMRVEVESLDTLLGVGENREDTRRERPRAEGEATQTGDTETTVYPLRKFMRLVTAGNPNVYPLLWTPNLTSPDVFVMRGLRDSLVSMKTVYAHCGFAGSVISDAERGKHNANRTHLVEEFGWDVKAGSHSLRCAYSITHLVFDGVYPMPMLEQEREHVLAVRRGEVPKDEVFAEVKELLFTLNHLPEGTLPAKADPAPINAWMRSVYLREGV